MTPKFVAKMLTNLLFSIVCLLLFGYFHDASAQITLVLDVNNLLKMQQGACLPPTLRVAEGNEALLKLTSSLDNQQQCTVTTPTGLSFDVRTPPNPRFESWSEDCGLRVRNVVKADEGRWRLTSAAGNNSVMGWTEVFVEENNQDNTEPPISLHDGDNNILVNLTHLENSYCVVTKPFSESTLIPGHCMLVLDRTTRAVQGNWSVLLGLPGHVTELQMQRRVAVETERLDIGYRHDTNPNKLHLYCNILHTTKNITFCRFQKTSNSYGYNAVDGLSDGSHSYYGEGFAMRQCGMTIENPTAADYGTWRCSVGVQMWVDNQIHQQTPMQALISVPPRATFMSQMRNEDGIQQVIVQDSNPFTIMCRADVYLAYCWFRHPNGSQYTPVSLVDEESQEFWYTGGSLQTGDCGITFAHASIEHEGEWTCHMGSRNTLGLETTDRVMVRVTGPLAAHHQQVTTEVGGSAELYCHTANGHAVLEYCRFLSPSLVGFSIDSSITQDNAILNRFYFTPGRHLEYGDCSLTINPVQDEDIGQWTCAAMIDLVLMEAKDTVTVNIMTPLNLAGIIGGAAGLAALVLILIGVLLYRRGFLRSSTPQEPRPASGTATRPAPRASNVSGTSNDSNDSAGAERIPMREL